MEEEGSHESYEFLISVLLLPNNALRKLLNSVPQHREAEAATVV